MKKPTSFCHGFPCSSQIGLLAIIALFLVTTITKATTMSSPVEITLSVTANNPELVANLHVVNTSDKPVYLDRWTIGMETSKTGDIFRILGPDNRPVAYTGILVKRKFSPADFIRLEPGQTLTSAIRLDDRYTLKPATYTIQFSAFNHGVGDQDMFEMTSNPVTIHYPAQPGKARACPACTSDGPLSPDRTRQGK